MVSPSFTPTSSSLALLFKEMVPSLKRLLAMPHISLSSLMVQVGDTVFSTMGSFKGMY